MKNRKQYFALISEDMVDYFESKLKKYEDEIHHIIRGDWETADDGTIFKRYVITADEGLIDPKYELKGEDI